MPIRLLALDIDGTLLDSHGRIPDDNVGPSPRRSTAASKWRW